ncbi:MAG: transcription-repair coupling factor [Epulopiscium sp. Nuni2H_MBin003]|nr:MAG: transcription-repair coupling factor [Epulopiscium sp. Nuni2H_MBin003]
MEKMALIEPLKRSEEFNKFISNFNNTKTGVVTGVVTPAKGHLIYSISNIIHKCPIVVAPDDEEALNIYQDLQFLYGEDEVLLYPSRDILFYNADVHSTDIKAMRIKILENSDKVIVTTIEALLNPLCEKNVFKAHKITIKEDDIINVTQLINKLIIIGYERCLKVEAIGQFAIRGGIIDIFSPVHNVPIRIELWDEQVDSIRRFSHITQRSIDKIEQIVIYPNKEIIIPPDTVDRNKIKKELDSPVNRLILQGNKEAARKLNDRVNEDLQMLNEMDIPELYAPFADIKLVTLFDYFKSDRPIFVTDINRCIQKLDRVWFEYTESIKDRLEFGHMLPAQVRFIFEKDYVLARALSENYVGFMNFGESENANTLELNIYEQLYKNMDMLEKELMEYKNKNSTTILLVGAKTKGIVEELEQRDVFATYSDKLDITPKNGQIIVSKGSLNKGFIYPDIGFVVISDKNLFGTHKSKKGTKKKYKGAKIESFLELSPGDYVVHEMHGVGIFLGVEQIIIEGINRDNLKIQYSDNATLYVNINQMDMVQKYIGDTIPKLNKLGTPEWKKSKAKVKSAAQNIARELISLYSKRENQRGFVYEPDTIWQQEFEDLFPYAETSDQLEAIKSVKEDMESDKIMDRLICGDVGYGKTEVAIRAAFKAVLNQKQVAYLVPTTILSQQHFDRFLKRMEPHGVSVSVLSRFRTPKQVKQTLSAIQNGMVDIVIGTHRLLSKDVKFKDLGLVIIDEEQRFGVTHKEKLKQMRTEVDVLTLTATPIPRTLHMSLIGIRDMSIIEEAPQNRRAVQTYVMEYSDEFIKDAINREINREGQVYFLFNQVKNIEETANKISHLVPNAKVAFAHGQMSERELENIMIAFENKEITVLVCTTIIETGLDIANANTIIINDADKMGLSQLYQLRGRVGRSDKVAYAYLLYKKDKVLKEVAEKRLSAIKQFTQLGAGFKIAMRDLEIRGAGDLLGAKQHGHMAQVGYDLYSKMLKEAIMLEQGEEIKPQIETTIEMKINAFIPTNYIIDEIQKLDIYKKIASIKTQVDYDAIVEEIEDRYGNLPASVYNLVDIALIKGIANEISILTLTQTPDNIILRFDELAEIKPEVLVNLTKEYDLKVKLAKNIILTLSTKNITRKELLKYIKNFLMCIHNLQKESVT